MLHNASIILTSICLCLLLSALFLSLGFPDFQEPFRAPFPFSKDTATPPDEPVPHVGVHLLLRQLPRRQPLAQLAVVRHTGVADHLVVRPPQEVGGELTGGLEEAVQVAGQRGRVLKLEGVNVGLGREDVGVVRAPEHHRNCVQFQSVESFLCDVVFTESILKTQVKSTESIGINNNVPNYIWDTGYVSVMMGRRQKDACKQLIIVLLQLILVQVQLLFLSSNVSMCAWCFETKVKIKVTYFVDVMGLYNYQGTREMNPRLKADVDMDQI